ncbi:MAG: hypothetical protein RSA20_08100 [Oscillospiraceae bacterium]
MENVVFTQSLMGFNRAQVLEYIDAIVKQLKDQEIEYTQKQERLQQEVDSLSEKCAENKEDLTLTVEKIQELSEEVEYFKKNNFELKNQIDHYRNLILTKDGEIISLKKDASTFKAQCEKLSAVNSEWKGKQDKIAECLINANLKAEYIVKEAEKEAENKTLAMKEKVDTLASDVVNLKDEISQVEKQLELSFQKLQKAMDDMDSSANTIERQVISYREKVEGISQELPQEVTQENVAATDEKKTVAEQATAAENTDVTKPTGAPSAHIARQYVKPIKKTLTDNVLDAISKIIGQN